MQVYLIYQKIQTLNEHFSTQSYARFRKHACTLTPRCCFVDPHPFCTLSPGLRIRWRGKELRVEVWESILEELPMKEDRLDMIFDGKAIRFHRSGAESPVGYRGQMER